MPIPFLFIAAGVGTGLLGVGKGIKAGIDQKEANDTNDAAEYKIEHAKERINTSRKNCGKSIDDLGKRKVAVLDGSIKTFISEFEKLNHVELSESSGLNELQKMVLDKKTFSDLKELQGEKRRRTLGKSCPGPCPKQNPAQWEAGTITEAMECSQKGIYHDCPPKDPTSS